MTDPAVQARASAGRLPGITRNVVVLGLVSMLTDVSSEMIVPVLPLFVTGVLHASVASVGWIEGVAESTATLLRVLSGWLSDRIGRRRPFLVAGYGLSAAAKTALALAAAWPTVLALRFADRLGKGLRNPARDALIADSVDASRLGRAFGFHRALDTLGAAIGPLIAFALLSAAPGDFRRVFLWSALPAALGLVAIAWVRAPRRMPGARPASEAAGPLGAPFRRLLLVAGGFALASSSTAFLLLLAREAGIDERRIPLVYLLYNLVYALLSWPAGELSDRFGRRRILIAAYASFAAIYAALAWRPSAAFVVAGFAALGVHSALLEGNQRSMVADLVPPGRRATAFGIYYAVTGVALLPASVIAGALWERLGPRVMLACDAAIAAIAALAFAILLPVRAERLERGHGHAA